MKKTITFIIFLLTMFFISAQTLFAEKDRVAILNFDAQNCPAATAKVVTDIVSTKIFETRVFTIVEREQIQQVFKELELQMTGCTDSACAVKIGKMLSANKIIQGTVHKVDRYIIVVKIVNVADNKVEGNYRAEALDEAEIEAASLDIAEKVKYDFKTDMYFGFSISGGYQAGIGDFSPLVTGGPSININFYAYNFLFKNMVLTVSTGAILLKGKNETPESIIGVPMMAYLGYSFNLARNIKILPSAGGGYYFFSMKYDPDNADVYGKYEYVRKTVFDPAVSVKIEFDFAVSSSVQLFLTPSYTFIFEKGYNPQLAGADAGVKLFF